MNLKKQSHNDVRVTTASRRNVERYLVKTTELALQVKSEVESIVNETSVTFTNRGKDPMKTFLHKIRHWHSCDKGSMSIEFLFAVPLFVAMISGATDLSRVFVDQSNYYSAARDTARIVARHAMDEASAEAYTTARIAQITSAPTVIDVAIDSTSVTVSIAAPISALAKFNFLDWLNLGTLTAEVTHTLEPT